MDLRMLYVQDIPWIMTADFNCILSRDERIGNPVRDSEMFPFSYCIMQCNLEDIKS